MIEHDNQHKFIKGQQKNHQAYRTRTISLSERINQSSSNLQNIPQSLEKLPLQETAI